MSSYDPSSLWAYTNSASTAFHAQELGFRTILVDDCSRGIKSEDIEKTKERIRENNGCVIHSTEVTLCYTLCVLLVLLRGCKFRN